MGMNTMSLKAVFHRILSSSTAKIRPRMVHAAGATSTHKMLLRMAMKVVSLVNMVT